MMIPKEGKFMFETRITQILGIEYPIMQGGMQNLGSPALAAAVSNAGGLGTINITMYPDLDDFRAALKETKRRTSKPFAINISLLPNISMGDKINNYIDIAAEEGVKAIETAGVSPVEYVSRIKSRGIVHIHKVPALKHAVSVEKLGVDIITAAGFEVGGHPGKDMIGTTVLTNLIARAVKVPVFAAGGFSDGRGLIAALALGAEGIVMGTRFVASHECVIHQNFKDWIVNHTENDTALCQQTIHNMVRVANNSAAKQCRKMEAQGATLQELMTVIAGAIGKQCYESGDTEGGMFPVGETLGLIHDVKNVKEIIEGIMEEASQILETLEARRVPALRAM
jgi:nitronate monooxygenase